jgi:Xaa-Pro aminopeptidase
MTRTDATGTPDLGTPSLGTPNLGTGVVEHRDRVDFKELRRARLARVLAAMDERSLDACFFGREANARYVSGVRRLWTAQTRPFVPACVVVAPNPGGAGVGDEPIVELLAFSASYEDIPAEVELDHFYPVTWNPTNLVERFRSMPGVFGARRIGFDGLSPLFEGMLREALPDAEFVGVEDTMRAIRRVKLPDEITCIRTAAAIAESSLYAAIAAIAPGVTEQHLRAAFMERMCELGTSQFAQQGTFTVIDPGGPLRWTTTDRVLRAGDAVALAGGALWSGYEGSLARTWCCGADPTTDQRDGYRDWRTVMDAVVAECRPGRTGADLRRAFEGSGGGEPGMTIAYFVGLGHEGPIAGPGMTPELERAQALEPGMVIAVRHFAAGAGAGYFGEDMLLVTDGGPEMLTTLGPGPLASAG